MNLQWNPCPKPSHNRGSKTAKQRGHIPQKVRDKAAERANGVCEWCGWVNGTLDPTGRKWGLQAAHLLRRWKCESTTETEIAMLCSPSTNSGTCHWKVDFTREGRAWAKEFRERLIKGDVPLLRK